ncbi:hypothetical protein ISF_08851 [Cordyceps fumosorosea ARSEF 2679]|uniref:DUF6598 domain-containing protein n=1 Tax=Cordyceps fumosorosea (strain ARSEF 2679) TaxID=1081104 RepID=A0A162MAG5_CORFA|nr:hypothetical protein ISF_08851 [Cordyceps fumosorosea ARSEF 2679]OAA53370.1 hypothetical protein ISF_08851 [Cordyceps fumosorosea ARSEF 2679]
MHVKYLHALVRTLLCVQHVTARAVDNGDSCADVARGKTYYTPTASCSSLTKREGETDNDEDCAEVLEELRASDYGIERTDYHSLKSKNYSGLDCKALLAILILAVPSKSHLGRRDGGDCDKAREIILGAGRQLAEIFWVRINNIDDENPGDLYGTIQATDSIGKQDIYNRERSDYESITPGQIAHLTGPAQRSISAESGFVLEFKLTDKDADASPDDEISFGEFVDKGDVLDQLQNKTVTGAYGSATANYVVMGNAAQADIDVILINGDDENPADVYGKVIATTKYGKRDLFNKDSKSYVELKPGDKVPLERKVMAVAMDDKLVTDVDLWDHDADLSPNDSIAGAIVTWVPEPGTSMKQGIRGRYGEAEIRVTWS